MGNFSGILLASDVDGTLLHDGCVCPRNAAAIERFVGGGGLFTVATGRTRLAMAPLLGQFPVNAPAVLGNGAFIYDYAADNIVFRRPLDYNYPEIAEAGLEIPGVALEIHSEDAVWVIRPNKHNDAHFEIIGAQGIVIGNLDEPPKPWLKMVFVGEPDELALVRARIAPLCGGNFSLVSSVDVFLECLHKDANKGAGVTTLAEMLKIERENVFVIGDNNNDVPMLKRFTGFVPANGTDEAKSVGTTVCANSDGAVADVVERLTEWVKEGIIRNL
ncbi:haloacid dehalogenase [Clostridia bacterium]|nr:haloacid dehalogenase [Clostridia bacterium]